MIYFVQLENMAIKIGAADDVDRRLVALETHYGGPVALLATAEGNLDREREIHEQFAHLRIGRTEQFAPASDLMEFIGKPLLGRDDLNRNSIERQRPRDVIVKIPAEVAQTCKIVAAWRGISMAEYLTELVRPLARRDMELEESLDRERTRRPKE